MPVNAPTSPEAPVPVLDVRNLKTQFRTRTGVVRAVDDVSLQLWSGETLGVVGESGCGKSMTALSILGLVPRPPGRIGGSIRLNEIGRASCRGRGCQYV